MIIAAFSLSTIATGFLILIRCSPKKHCIQKLKLLRHFYPKHRVMGFRKRFFYLNRGMGFDI